MPIKETDAQGARKMGALVKFVEEQIRNFLTEEIKNCGLNPNDLDFKMNLLSNINTSTMQFVSALLKDTVVMTSKEFAELEGKKKKLFGE